MTLHTRLLPVSLSCFAHTLDNIVQYARLPREGFHMTPLGPIQLPALMTLTSGSEDIVIALLDGPVALDHPDLLSDPHPRYPRGNWW
jgi:hypothetical protein